MASSFYKDLYTSEGVQGIGEVLNTTPVKVDAAMNEMLNAPFDSKEVKTALWFFYSISTRI